MPIEVPDKAMCIGCGYSLRGLPDPVCPECGRAFDPADRSTFTTRFPRDSWRFWAGPPRDWHVYGIALTTVAFLYSSIAPGYPTEPVFALLGLFEVCAFPVFAVLVVIDYTYRAIVVVLDRRRAVRDRTPLQNMGRWRWVVTPACVTLIVSVLLSDWPMRAAFHLGRPALEKAATDFTAGKRGSTRPQWIGLYHIEAVLDGEEGTVYF